ncbi:MAG: hypothetical protein ACOCV1_07935, partial [Bacillota bacterium]
ILISIKQGEWKKEDVIDFFSKKEKELKTLYNNSTLPEIADKNKIKKILINCLEEHYGNLSRVININEETELLDSIESNIKQIMNSINLIKRIKK